MAQKTTTVITETTPRRSNLASRLFFGLVILLGAIAIGHGVWTLLQSHRCKRWPTTDGVIKSATITRHKRHRVSISYDYQVAGIRYTGTRLAFGENMSHGQWILNRYPVGKKIPVHYSSSEPQLAVLETGVHGGTVTDFGVGTLFVLAGCMFLKLGKANLGVQKVKLQKPPILMGVIFVVFGSFIGLMTLLEQSHGWSGRGSSWAGYGAGGFFVLAGFCLLAARYLQLRRKPNAQ